VKVKRNLVLRMGAARWMGRRKFLVSETMIIVKKSDKYQKTSRLSPGLSSPGFLESYTLSCGLRGAGQNGGRFEREQF
jgi:hypothetical protein